MNSIPSEAVKAQSYLVKFGYAAALSEDGSHVVVQDPVHRCGFGKEAGKLIPAGFQPVTVRTLAGAVTFVNKRT